MGTIITLGMPRAVEKGGVGGLHLLPGARLRNSARAGHALDAGLWAQTLDADASRGTLLSVDIGYHHSYTYT